MIETKTTIEWLASQLAILEDRYDYRLAQLEHELAAVRAQLSEGVRFTSRDGATPAVTATGIGGASGLYASSEGDAIFAESHSGTAIFASSLDGEGIITESSRGPAVRATSKDGEGVLASSTNGTALSAWSTSAHSDSRAVQAYSLGGTAVSGASANGYGGQFSGGQAPLRLMPAQFSGPPMTGMHARGELLVDCEGRLFLCVADGTPGTWRHVVID
jgi:hypothetical protein